MITDDDYNNNNNNNNNNKCYTSWLKGLVATYENSTRVMIRQQQIKTWQKSRKIKKQSVTVHVIKIRSM
jgi:hypothetical protein